MITLTRFPTEAAFASWTGTAPIDASSGDQATGGGTFGRRFMQGLVVGRHPLMAWRAKNCAWPGELGAPEPLDSGLYVRP